MNGKGEKNLFMFYLEQYADLNLLTDSMVVSFFS